MDTAKLTIIGNNKGFAIVYIALAIFVLVGCLGLVIDLGHMYVVRGELQNAADASALAGAAALYTDTGGVLTPNPSGALAAATGFISQNKSDNTALATGTVVTGYWEINATPSCMSPPCLNPPTGPATPRPAVGVTVGRSAGINGGAVPVFFAKVLPAIPSTAPVTSTQAVAIRGFAGSVPPGAHILPLALPKGLTDAFFSQIPIPTTLITIGNGSTYYGYIGGQWTPLTPNPDNSASTLITLVDNYLNGPALKTGDYIYLSTGATPMVYNEVQVQVPVFPVDVFVPIVDDIIDNTSRPIVGFASFHIVSTTNTTITGQFIGMYAAPPGSLPGGSLSNALTTHPQMVH